MVVTTVAVTAAATAAITAAVILVGSIDPQLPLLQLLRLQLCYCCIIIVAVAKQTHRFI